MNSATHRDTTLKVVHSSGLFKTNADSVSLEHNPVLIHQGLNHQHFCRLSAALPSNAEILPGPLKQSLNRVECHVLNRSCSEKNVVQHANPPKRNHEDDVVFVNITLFGGFGAVFRPGFFPGQPSGHDSLIC